MNKENNLWLLTEERPKPTVVLQILEMYCRDFGDSIDRQGEIKIKPIIKDGTFLFVYLVEGISTRDSKNIYIKTVSGSSSFFDFLLFKQAEEPRENSTDSPIMAIEETKTNDDESRNTGVYQRGSKFVYINQYYNNTKLYMLYNDELEARESKQPSDTSIYSPSLRSDYRR